MHFSEIRGMALLTILLAAGILAVGRLTRPAAAMDRAIARAEKAAQTAPPSREAAAYRAALGAMGAAPAAPAAARQGQVAASLGAAGRSCAQVAAVIPIDARRGLYRIVCRDGGGERRYRLDTRKGIATADDNAA